MQRSLKFASLMACCALAVGLYAQDEGRRPAADPPPGGEVRGEGRVEGRIARRGPMQIQDRDLAAMLMISNRGEVEFANFVKPKLQCDKCKELADMMVKDHTAFLEKLTAFAAPQGERPAGNAEATPRQPQPAGVAVDAGPVQVQVGKGERSFYAPGTNPIIALKEEIAQECMANTKKELEGKQGQEFHKCFVGKAIGSHQEAVAVLTVFQRRAQDSQFKEALGAALEKTQHHLDMAKKIMKEIEQQKPAE
jgi:predicted outer membrane protein